MLIAQLTDIHIGFEPGNPEEPNLQRLRAVVDHLVSGPNRPDLLLLTGDLTENGSPADYARLAETLAPCPFPVWPLAGNHDQRAALLEAFPQIPRPGDGFVHYALDDGAMRVIVLDTLEPGRHGGGFCEARAAWLGARLAEAPERPTLIALHHPPFPAGIPWMDTDQREPWVARLADCLSGQPQVKALVCGHVHRTILAQWQGLPVMVCPSVAPAVGLDLTRLDPDQPDARKLITDEPPAYALHHWNGHALVSHFEPVGAYRTLARFDPQLQPMIRDMVRERP